MRRTVQRSNDGLFNSISFIENLIVPKPQYAKSLFFQPRTTFQVVRNLFRMLTSIQLNDQLLLKTDKVNNLLTYGLLSAKLISGKLTETKMLPQRTFSISHILS
jgi:hypothetical protein